MNKFIKNKKTNAWKSAISMCFFLISFCTATVFAQQGFTVTGTVTDDAGDLLPGVNIIVAGTSTGTISDVNGRYSINVPDEEAVLQFIFMGFNSQFFQVGSLRVIDVQMTEDAQELEELVVTGYGTQRRADLTGAVAVVRMDDVENIVSSNIMQNLQGQVPGLFISGGGNPVGDPTVRVRGISTLSTGPQGTASRSDPLYIIDGVPTTANMNTLAASDIESIQVLKDASAASIYGSRASNGVIIITTRRADGQTTSVRLRSSMNVRTYAQRPLNWLNTEERGLVAWQAARNSNVTPNSYPYIYHDHQDANGNWVLDRIELPEWIDPVTQTMRTTETDWVGEILQSSITQNHNLTISTGGARGRALLAVDYLDNVGHVRGTFNNRMSVRLNSDFTVLNNRINIGQNLSITKTKRSTLDGSNLLSRTRYIMPMIPVRREDGIGWGGNFGAMDDDGLNPVRMIEWEKDNHLHILRLFGNIFAEFEIIDNLRFRTNLGLDQNFTYSRIMEIPISDGGINRPRSAVTSRFDRGGTLIWNNTLSYAMKFDRHNVDVMVGHEQTDTNSENQRYVRTGYDMYDPDFMYIFSGDDAITLSSGNNSASQYRLLSFFGRANYNYDNKYLASFTLRRDGSSRFGVDNQFATFPAFSLGWRISEESFFSNAVPFVSDFKFRYGWGMTGNQQGIGNFASRGLYVGTYSSSWINDTNFDQSTAYDIQGIGTGTRPMGYRRTQIENRNLRWEAATQNNIGVDFGLFNQKLMGSVDFFHIKTTDILVTPPVLAVMGEGAGSTVNGATIENRGYEFVLTYRDRRGELRYSVTGNLSAYNNEVVMLPTEVITAYPGNGADKTIIGRPLSSVFGYYADGLFRTEQELDNGITQTGKGLGRIRYRDIAGPNATGPDNEITLADRDYFGKTEPDFIYGINFNVQYRQWDFNMFWNGRHRSFSNVHGTKSYEHFFGGVRTGGNYGRGLLNAWSPDNPNSNIPRLSANDLNNEVSTGGASRTPSTYFWENTSYFRLRNMEIGYTVPRDISNRIYIQNARFYILGENLMKFYKKSGQYAFTGADPETPGTAYPLPISMTIGLNVTF